MGNKHNRLILFHNDIIWIDKRRVWITQRTVFYYSVIHTQSDDHSVFSKCSLLTKIIKFILVLILFLFLWFFLLFMFCCNGRTVSGHRQTISFLGRISGNCFVRVSRLFRMPHVGKSVQSSANSTQFRFGHINCCANIRMHFGCSH